MRIRLAAVGVLAALLTGCSVTPAPIGAITQSSSPRREALQYFPANAPAVALVATDPTSPNVRRLATSGALAPLEDFAESQKLFYSQYRTLLGNEAVVGQPDVGGPPLAVLVTQDSNYLENLAESRVRARLARHAGEYRGATFYQAKDWAFAVRGPVLLVAGNVKQIVDALDIRVTDDSFDAAQMNAVLPEGGVDDAVLRAYVDLRPYLDERLPATVREIPVVRALSLAGIAVRAEADQLDATLVASTADTGLTAADLPGPAGSAPVRVLRDPRNLTIGVANFADFAVAAERALKSALPVTGLQFDALYTRLKGAGITLADALFTGPAYAVWTEHGPRLVWRAALPGAIELGLHRASKNLRTPGVKITLHRDGLYTVRNRGRFLMRIGVVRRRVVAGRASAQELKRLARAAVTKIPGGRAVVRIPALSRWLPHPIGVALTGTGDRVIVRARTEP
jgi:hypothetical protein